MKVLAAILAVVLAGTATANADEQPCSPQVASVLLVSDWAVSEVNGGARVTFSIENSTGKAIRMNDASLWFTDALGRIVGIGGAKLDPDLRISATGTTNSEFLSGFWPRLLVGEKQDFSATICTHSVLYEDGTREDFE